MPRLVWGAIEPADRPHSHYTARRRFVDAIQRCAPKVLDDLSGEPFQAYCDAAVFPVNERGMIVMHHLDLPKMNLVMPKICACLIKHNIHVQWLHDWVILTFLEWAKNPNEKWTGHQRTRIETWKGKFKIRDGALEFEEPVKKVQVQAWWEPGLIAQTAFPDDERTLRYELKLSDPTVFPYDLKEERKRLKAEIMAEFEQKLDHLLEKLNEVPEGFVRIANIDSDQHFDWVVDCVVNGLSRGKIAEKYQTGEKSVSESAVGKAINEKAKLLDLDPPFKKGRPKKRELQTCRFSAG